MRQRLSSASKVIFKDPRSWLIWCLGWFSVWCFQAQRDRKYRPGYLDPHPTWALTSCPAFDQWHGISAPCLPSVEVRITGLGISRWARVPWVLISVWVKQPFCKLVWAVSSESQIEIRFNGFKIQSFKPWHNNKYLRDELIQEFTIFSQLFLGNDART